MDGFQGQEKEVILLSMVRSNCQQSIGFLKEHRRLNVAVTRARRQLVVVADKTTFQKNKVYKSLFNYIEKNGDVGDANVFGRPPKVDIPSSFGLINSSSKNKNARKK